MSEARNRVKVFRKPYPSPGGVTDERGAQKQSPQLIRQGPGRSNSPAFGFPNVPSDTTNVSENKFSHLKGGVLEFAFQVAKEALGTEGVFSRGGGRGGGVVVVGLLGVLHEAGVLYVGVVMGVGTDVALVGLFIMNTNTHPTNLPVKSMVTDIKHIAEHIVPDFLDRLTRATGYVFVTLIVLRDVKFLFVIQKVEHLVLSVSDTGMLCIFMLERGPKKFMSSLEVRVLVFLHRHPPMTILVIPVKKFTPSVDTGA